ncbi:hypothetical protein [Stenotrophomonas sp. HMWF023]|nr:hypothetical protein [Stenotrophomonas sp. HMWF023]
MALLLLAGIGLVVGVDLGRHVDPRHAWMIFDQLSRYSISMEIHPRMA